MSAVGQVWSPLEVCLKTRTCKERHLGHRQGMELEEHSPMILPPETFFESTLPPPTPHPRGIKAVPYTISSISIDGLNLKYILCPTCNYIRTPKFSPAFCKQEKKKKTYEIAYIKYSKQHSEEMVFLLKQQY